MKAFTLLSSLGSVLLLMPAIFAQQSGTVDALRGLASDDPLIEKRSSRFLKEHYKESKAAMIASLDCSPGLQSYRLGYVYSAVGESAIPDLVVAFSRGTKQQKMNIARILTYFDKTPDLGVRTLQKFLGEKDPDVRSAIIDALGDLRKSSSIPLIAKQLNDQHSTVRSAAIGSLLRFGSESYLIAPVIIKSMRANRGDADFLGTAALCLGTIGHRAIPAIDAEIMNRENPVVLREYFLDALGNMGAYGNSDKAVLAIPTLTKAINAVEPEIRCRALSSLWAICRSSKNIDPDKDLNAILQIGAIKKRPANERLLVASIAALFKKYRVVAIPVFDEALRSRDATLVQRALANCILLEEDMGALSFAMIYVMNHAADAIKLSAIEAVGGDPRFIVALPTLLRIIAGDKDPACRRAAMAAAGRASLSILTIVARRIVFL